MKKSLKTALCTILGICLIATLLAGCAQAGNERALPNGANNGLTGSNQSLNKSNLVGGRYDYNYGTNGTNMTDYNGYRYNNGYTGYDPSNYLSYNGINTINYNNRYNRMSNNGTGLGSNGALTGNTLTGNNRMLTGNNIGNTMSGNDTYRASMIKRQLDNMSGINNCSVVVSGDTALVGLRTNGNSTTSMSRLRASIERRVKQADSRIKNVTVTDSTDILTRMGRLGTTTGNYNGGTNNFMQEFNTLMNSINTTGR